MLKKKLFLNHREWPYKDVEPKIIAEQYTVDESGYELKDYKFFCFNGKPKAMFIATDRGKDTKFDFFDTEFHHLPFTNGHPNANRPIQNLKITRKCLNCWNFIRRYATGSS